MKQILFPKTVSIFAVAALTILHWVPIARADSVSAPLWSVAGLYPLPDSGRTVLSADGGWRFVRGDVPGAEQPSFEDKAWLPVNLPHGLEVLPEEASGCVNYQGPAWYRTRLTVPESSQDSG